MAIKRMKDSQNFLRLQVEGLRERVEEECDPEKIKQITKICDDLYEKIEKFLEEEKPKPKIPHFPWEFSKRK